jgi:hypothetical protein
MTMIWSVCGHYLVKKPKAASNLESYGHLLLGVLMISSSTAAGSSSSKQQQQQQQQQQSSVLLPVLILHDQ